MADLPYRPVRPPAAFSATVVCRWDASFLGGLHLVPDGCVELMWLEGRGVIVCGPETGAWGASYARRIEGAGVRLRPGAAAAALHVDVSELRDRRIQAADLWGSAVARRLDEQLQERPAAGRSEILLRLVHGIDAPAEAAPLMAAVARGASVAGLALATGVSERQLQRRSRQLFGYGLTTLRAVLRLQRVMALATTHRENTIADLASAAGYADHSHLARDSARLTGLTPSELFASQAPSWHGSGSVVTMSDSSKPNRGRAA
ncbi:MAG: helix-turn-helix domain-containing protein [Propionicimonas sp.]|uniref:AraC family transcriptional regulator n=1 Tax=Propionicimonas sp. TaxID=1955623 RepID=UPI002B2145B7|nr:helix-turn-helix domain-containing protein [Propionicimonas sp.]MEA4944782.1 helix-turn-helix domain-containing protein [Propionicimonas sp.]